MNKLDSQILENLLNIEEDLFEKNKNLIFVNVGDIVQTQKGFFIVIENGKNNTKTIVPIIPYSTYASKGDYIFLAPKDIFPIADRWTVLSDYKITLPYGFLKYGYLQGSVSEDFVEKIKQKNNINRNPDIKDIFDRWLKDYIQVSNFINQKNKLWLNTKTASDRISKFENGVFINIEPESIELISTENNVIIELYIDDILFDVAYYNNSPVRIELDNIDPESFEKSLKVLKST